jgi:hypothetical protein
MSARTRTQIPGFRGDVIAPGHHDDYDARAVRNGTVDLFHANQNIAPAKRR